MRKRAPTKKAAPKRAARTAREADLRDLFENIQRRDRKVGDALIVILRHVADAPGSGLIQAISTVMDFALKQQGGRR